MKAFPKYQRRVNFADTDMAGIVHFSMILRYVEEAEHFVLQELGITPISASGGFPKVHVECDYRTSLKFGDEAEVQMSLKKVGNRSLKWAFTVTAGDVVAAEGEVVTVFVGDEGRATMIPDDMLARLSNC